MTYIVCLFLNPEYYPIVWNSHWWTCKLFLLVSCHDKCCRGHPVHVAQSVSVRVWLVHSPSTGILGFQGNACFPLHWISSSWSLEWLNNLNSPLSLEKDLLLPSLPSQNLVIITTPPSNGSEVIAPCEFNLPFLLSVRQVFTSLLDIMASSFKTACFLY